MPQLGFPLDISARRVKKNYKISLSCPLADESDEYVRREQLVNLCASLIQAISNPSEHFEQLNKLLSTLLPQATHEGSSNVDGELANGTVTKRASQILERLPPTPLGLLS
jgi:hypothetical protein